MENQEYTTEKAILVGLDADVFDRKDRATEASMAELEALLETAGGTCAAVVTQHRHAPDSHSFIGEGKVEEIAQLLETEEANMIVFDNDLSPSQIRALEDMTGATVLDRSALILDIFAQRAKTKEGRLQVELAQYQYLLPRLSGMGKSMSRLGGGIGTRGPGETKLETDRRHIRERIDKLKEELAAVRKVRATQRQRRMKNQVPVVAIVGYTNAGKSTLLNHLTDAGIPANNRLFDTLDTTTRKLQITDILEVLLSDTVGFIAKLPHHLVEAFQATLEELAYADLLLHVVDAADPERDAHMAVVEELMTKLAPEIPVITCYNKVDLTDDILPHGENILWMSAKSGLGMDDLFKAIEENVGRKQHHEKFLLPYSQGGLLDTIHNLGKVIATDYVGEGIVVEAVVDDVLFGKIERFMMK